MERAKVIPRVVASIVGILLLGATAVMGVQQLYKSGSLSLYTFNAAAAPADLEAISVESSEQGGTRVRYAVEQKALGSLEALRFSVGIWDSAGNLKGKAFRDGQIEASGAAVSLELRELDVDPTDTMIVTPLSSTCGDVHWSAAGEDFSASVAGPFTPAFSNEFINDQIRLLQECGPGFCTVRA